MSQFLPVFYTEYFVLTGITKEHLNAHYLPILLNILCW